MKETKQKVTDWENLGISNDFIFAKVMQNKEICKELPQRSRYYQSIIDMELIEKGKPYKLLNKSYVIFICRFDLFKKGRCRYTFEERCVEDTSIRLNDGATRIFLNTKGILVNEDISDDLRAFLEYVEGMDSENLFVKKVDDAIKEVKENKKLRRQYMNQVVRDQLNRDAGYADGHADGRIEERVVVLREIGIYNEEIVQKLVERFEISEDKAWEYVKK